MMALLSNLDSLPQILAWTKILFCISSAVPSAEYLFIGGAFRPQGVFAGQMLALNEGGFNMLPRRLNKALFSYPAFVSIHVAKLLLCIGLVLLPTSASGYLLWGLVGLSLLFLSRNPIGNDGSDQMNLIICLALAILHVQPGNLVVANMSLFFIAAQALLSYFVAGVAKLLSKEWRAGLAVKGIMNTRTYGNSAISHYLNQDRQQWLNVALCWSIIVMEMAFPLVLFLPAPYFWLIIAWGVCFHLYNAVVMGLNVFFWAFIATYPSILLLRLALGA